MSTSTHDRFWRDETRHIVVKGKPPKGLRLKSLASRSFFTLVALVSLNIAGCDPHANQNTGIQKPLRHADAQTTTPDNSQAIIPIWLNESGSVTLQAQLNDLEELNLMLHTGVRSASLTRTATSRLSSLHWDAKEEVTSWGGDAEARVSMNNKLRIGPITLSNLSLTEVEQAASGTDGKLGVSQLGYDLIEFDFEDSVVRLFNDSPNDFQSYHSLPLTTNQGLMFVKAKLTIGDQTLEHVFMIHTGYGGTLLLDDEFVRSQQLTLRLPVLGHRELQDSYGNKLRTTQSLIDGFRIGDITIPDVSVELFDSSLGRQKISVVGVALLRHIDFVLDLKGCRMLIPASGDQEHASLGTTGKNTMSER